MNLDLKIIPKVNLGEQLRWGSSRFLLTGALVHDSWSCDQELVVTVCMFSSKIPIFMQLNNRREVSQKNSILIVSGQVAKARSQDRLTLHSLKKVGCDRYSCSELMK